MKHLKTGIGLRAPHHHDVLARLPDAGFLEVHAENFFHIGSIPFELLLSCRKHYPISLHGVGLSLGSSGGVSAAHLTKLKNLTNAIDPLLVSDHISWSGFDGRHVPDLLPLPYSDEALDTICRNIDHVQETLGRRILVENPSIYLAPTSQRSEVEFITALTQRTGCGLLLDINNIYVSAFNTGFNAAQYIADLPQDIVGEIHLAGHENKGDVLIDAHNNLVADDVWTLYAAALQKFGDINTLIEWDSDLPPLDILLSEAAKADDLRLKARHAKAA